MSVVNEAAVVLTTLEKMEDAERLAQALIESGLAACVQILPPMVSIYRWQGKIERASEVLVLIKTTRTVFPALETAIKQNHPYQTPEIISLPVQDGSKDYFDWLAASLSPDPPNPTSDP